MRSGAVAFCRRATTPYTTTLYVTCHTRYVSFVSLITTLLFVCALGALSCRPSRQAATQSAATPARHLLNQGYATLEYEGLYATRPPAGFAMLSGFDQDLYPEVLGASTLGAYARRLRAEHPGAVTAIALYVDAAYSPGVLEGEFDREIARLADTLALLSGDTYVAIGLNVDNPAWGYDTARFRKTYTYVASRLRPRLKRNVRLTFYVNGAEAAGDYPGFEAFYPGDEFVDALAYNVTRVRPRDFDEHEGFSRDRYAALDAFARRRALPIVIMDSSADALIAEGGLDGAASVEAFYDPFFDLIERSSQVRYYTHQNRWLTDSTVLARWQRRLRSEDTHPPRS